MVALELALAPARKLGAAVQRKWNVKKAEKDPQKGVKVSIQSEGFFVVNPHISMDSPLH